MYRDSRRVVERKLGQTQTVLSAHVKNLNSNAPVKKLNSESFISFACNILNLVGVFQSFFYKKSIIVCIGIFLNIIICIRVEVDQSGS